MLCWFSGALILSGLWMFDTILTFVQYCSLPCLWDIPLIGLIKVYDAESIAWVLIILGSVLLLAGWPRERGESKKRKA